MCIWAKINNARAFLHGLFLCVSVKNIFILKPMINNLSLKAVFYSAIVLGAGMLASCSEDNSTSTPPSISCSTESLPDSTGLVILCNGDSIGVIYNGKDGSDGKDGSNGKDGSDGKDGTDGTDGKDGSDGKDGTDGKDGSDGTNCKVLDSTPEVITVLCGEDTSTIRLTVDQSPTYIYWAVGTRVIASEVANATLKGTGNFYKGVFDQYLFDLAIIRLASQYVLLDAQGYYVRFMTGQFFETPIALRAICDKGRSYWVNINYLTEMEYERVFYIVNNLKNSVTGLNVRPLHAKKMAESEIFRNFHIDDSQFQERLRDDYYYVEDMQADIGGGDADGAYLAISILMEGDLSPGELTERLTRFGYDIQRDGSYDDVRTRARMAEWALDAESKGRFTQVRQWMKKRNIWSGPPDFEKYIHKYWTNELGLGDCYEKTEGALKHVSNSWSIYYAKDFDDYSNSSVRFVCHEGHWAVATESDMATGAYNPTEYLSCGSKYYDSEKSFCNNSVIYELCGGATYDPSAEVCIDGAVKPLCGDEPYDVGTEFCVSKVIYELCGGATYDPATEICNGTEVVAKETTEEIEP